MESTAETVFRGVLGSVGTAGGIVSGVAIVPSYHALDSAVAGVWNLGVNTIIIPVVGIGWNTLVGPPLALVGQKPSESRVDGFWVTMVGPDRAPITSPPSQEEIRLLGQWGLLLLKETKPFVQKQLEIDRNAAEQEAQLQRALQAMRAEADRQRTELRNQERTLIQQAAAANELSSALLSQHSALAYRGNCEADVRRYLKGLKVSGEDVERVLSLLRAFPSPRSVAPSPMRQKTDPLRRSVEVIGESAADALK